jgi:hypothetical protein
VRVGRWLLLAGVVGLALVAWAWAGWSQWMANVAWCQSHPFAECGVLRPPYDLLFIGAAGVGILAVAFSLATDLVPSSWGRDDPEDAALPARTPASGP